MDPIKAADEILCYLNYRGVFQIDKLPNLHLNGMPVKTFIVKDEEENHYGISIFSSSKAVLFNPYGHMKSVPGKLIEDLALIYTLIIVKAIVAKDLKHTFGACIYFLYFCNNFNVKDLFIHLPEENTIDSHMLNIHDFLKCQCPSVFNNWL